MNIIKIITDEKPKRCTFCPLIKLRICGEVSKERATSGAIYYICTPDRRCKITQENK